VPTIERDTPQRREGRGDSPDDHPATQRIRVAVCDDAFGMRALMRRWLERDGDIEVIASAASGAALLAAVARRLPEVVVLDLVLPDEDDPGALVDRLRALGAERVLLVSALPEPQLALRAALAGADAWVAKTADAAAIRAAVRSLCPRAAAVALPSYR
jgi:DNA-binding NarL/FixJ family response regulator